MTILREVPVGGSTSHDVPEKYDAVSICKDRSSVLHSRGLSVASIHLLTPGTLYTVGARLKGHVQHGTVVQPRIGQRGGLLQDIAIKDQLRDGLALLHQVVHFVDHVCHLGFPWYFHTSQLSTGKESDGQFDDLLFLHPCDARSQV